MIPENLPNGSNSSELYRLLIGNSSNGLMMDDDFGSFPSSNYDLVHQHLHHQGGGSFNGSSSSSYYHHPFEVSDLTEIPQARALVASKNHREAEKRRRERINSHLNRLRSLLPCNSKIDKASLLAKVIQHVKDLKEKALEISDIELFPSEIDEISVDFSGNGRSIMKASLCCEDRSDLLPDLIETLKSLRLKTLRAEMATLGGRVRNVLLVTSEDDDEDNEDNQKVCDESSIGFLRDALKTLIDRSNSNGERSKRRRVLDRRIPTTTTSTTTTT